MDTTIHAGGSHPDLLSAIYGIEINHNEKISDHDRQFCETQQEALYKALDTLVEWHSLFKSRSTGPEYEKYNPVWQDDGTVKFINPYFTRYSNSEGKYSDFEFLPLKRVNLIVELYNRACETFAKTIMAYFNKNYTLDVPEYERGVNENVWAQRPVYQTIVDHVLDHLGGKTFRQKAEEEIIGKFLERVKPWNCDKSKPEIKGDKIIFPRAARYSDYSWGRINEMGWENYRDFNDFIAGLMLGSMNILNGHAGHIQDFDRENIDFDRWYNLTINGAVTMKLYKNGRVDVKFRDKESAELCYSRLKLETLEIKQPSY